MRERASAGQRKYQHGWAHPRKVWPRHPGQLWGATVPASPAIKILSKRRRYLRNRQLVRCLCSCRFFAATASRQAIVCDTMRRECAYIWHAHGLLVFRAAGIMGCAETSWDAQRHRVALPKALEHGAACTTLARSATGSLVPAQCQSVPVYHYCEIAYDMTKSYRVSKKQWHTDVWIALALNCILIGVF